MVGCVVVNQKDLVRVIDPQELFQEQNVRCRIEDGLCAVNEAGAVQIDRTKDLAAFSTSCSWDSKSVAIS